jgi:hypothetical protein
MRTTHATRVTVAAGALLRVAGRRLDWRVHAGVPVNLSAGWHGTGVEPRWKGGYIVEVC